MNQNNHSDPETDFPSLLGNAKEYLAEAERSAIDLGIENEDELRQAIHQAQFMIGMAIDALQPLQNNVREIKNKATTILSMLE